MAMSLNKVQIIGNVVRDPEMRQIPGGQTVTNFSIATNRTWNDKSGQKQEKVEFHNIVAWGKLGEICGTYLKKGGKAYIEGRIETRSWEADDGAKRYKTEIVADSMIMLDKKGSSTGGDLGTAPRMNVSDVMTSEKDAAPAAEPAEPKKVTANAGDVADKEIEIEDLPF